MKKIIPYSISALGILFMALSTDIIQYYVPIIKNIPKQYILLPGIILVGIGVILMMGGSKKHHAQQEVPIYKGKKIVGYRVEE